MIQSTLQRYRAAYSGLPREVWMLAIVLFVNRAGTMVLPFMTLYLTSQLRMSEAIAGRLISVYGLGAVCGAYLGGRLAGRFGAIRLQTVCMFLVAPMFLLLPLGSSWTSMAALLFGLSVIAEAVRPANATAITQFTTPDNRMRAFALQRLAANLGFSFGPAIGGFLAEYDFKLLFAVDGLSTLAAGVALVGFFRMRRFGRVDAAAETPTVLPSPLRDGVFVTLLLLMLVSMIAFTQFGSTYPLFLRDHFGMEKPTIGLMFAVNTTVIVAVEMLLLDAIKHWHVVKTIGWGCFLFCLGWGILPFGQTAAFAVLAMLIVTVGEMLSFAMSTGFVANRSGPGGESAYMGWYMVMFAAASVLGPAIGGEIYKLNPNAVWYSCLAVGVFALIGFQVLARYMGNAAAETVEEVLEGATDGSPADGYHELQPGQPLLGIPETV
jgi:predicted MFS family arabinose efflux permease